MPEQRQGCHRQTRSPALTLALTATILIDLGDIVWWTLPWPWKLHQAAYNLTAILIPGLVLARFVRPDGKAAAPNTP